MPGGNPRFCCAKALERWENGREFADEVLHQVLAGVELSSVNRSFVTETFYGVLRNRTFLDYVITQFRDGRIDSLVRQILRLGIYQLYFMRIPDHAAVYETVELAGPARGLVNAVLRRAIKERPAIQESLPNLTISVRYSHPEFLVEKWTKRFSEPETIKLCEWNNTPAKIYFRTNLLRITPAELERTLSHATPLKDRPDCFEVGAMPRAQLRAGVGYVQDRSTLLACDLLNPQPGETVLDACAAPGGKSGYLAQLMQNRGKLVACDQDSARLQRMSDNLKTLGVAIAEICRVDWLRPGNLFPEKHFDAVLLDAPCTNTGVIRRRVDVRWRIGPGDFSRMPELQLRMLQTIATLVRNGGRLVYSTCSLEPEENESVVDSFQKQEPGFRLTQVVSSQPNRDGFDGAFAARFVRS